MNEEQNQSNKKSFLFYVFQAMKDWKEAWKTTMRGNPETAWKNSRYAEEARQLRFERQKAIQWGAGVEEGRMGWEMYRNWRRRQMPI